MKKKILLMLTMVAMLVCIFAISVSAATYYYYENSVAEENKLYYIETEFEGRGRFELTTVQSGVGFAKTNEDGEPLTWYVTEDTTDENGVRHIVVKAIKTMGEAGTIDANGLYTYGTGTVKDVTSKNVVSTNFFGTEVKTLSKGAFMATASTTPSGSTSEYYQIADGSYLLCLYLPKTLTAIPDQLCYRCPVKVLEFEDNTVMYNTIPQKAFQFCGLERLVIPEGIETIQGQSFRENCELTYIEFPSTMATLVENVFFRCNAIETVVFGEKMTQIGFINTDCTTMGQTGTGKGGQGLAIKYMYVPNTINAASNFDGYRGSGNGALTNINISIVFLFVGTLEEANVVAQYDNGHFENAIANAVEYSVYIENREKYDNYDSTQHVLVYNVPECVPYYDNTHDVETSVSYANGFIAGGEKKTKCLRENCCYVEIEELEAIFEFDGYSIKDDGSALCVGYAVNKEALAVYSEYNGELQYGVAASVIDEDEGLDILIVSDGKVSANTQYETIAVSISSKYSGFAFKLTGFTSEHMDKNIVMCAYAFDGEAISYLTRESNGGTPETVTFNEILTGEGNQAQ